MSEIFSGRLQAAERVHVLTFIILQCLDLATTLLVFGHGGVELNPVVRSLVPGVNPAIGVVASKGILITLAFPLSRRRRVLLFGNALYLGVVAWNLWILAFGKQ